MGGQGIGQTRMVCKGKWRVEFREASVEDGCHVEGDEEGACCVGGSRGIVWALYVQKVSVSEILGSLVLAVRVLGKGEDKSSIPFYILSCFVVCY